MEWVVVPFSRELRNPRIEPRSLALQEDTLPADSLSGGFSIREMWVKIKSTNIHIFGIAEREKMGQKMYVKK